MKKLIKITTIYNEEIIRIELRRDKTGIYTGKGFIPFEDIMYVDEIGVIDEENFN